MNSESSPAITVPVSSLLCNSFDKFGPLKTKTLLELILKSSVRTSDISFPVLISNPLAQLINFPF